MYLAFCNLPIGQRFRRENMLLVGVIPDMKSEPKTNTFLAPLVDELNKAWSEGFFMYSFKSPNVLKCFKMALICVGCDIPASRKLFGFLGHSATAGCNKCKKKFPGGVGEKIMEVLIELHGLVGIMKVKGKSATCYKIVPAKVKEKVMKETLAQDTQYCWN
jgi:hypothetical protein